MDSLTIFCAKYAAFAVVLLVGIYWLMQNRRTKVQLALSLIIGGTVAIVLAKIASKIYYDPRPFVNGNVKPLIAHSPDNGFPSDHTLLAMTLASVLFFYKRNWGYAALALTLAVGVSRVLAHLHSPIDIIGSLVFGFAGAYVGYSLAKKLYLAPAEQSVKNKDS